MNTIRQRFSVQYSYPVIFTRNAFNPSEQALGEVLLGAVPPGRKLLILVDSGVMDADPALQGKLQLFARQYGDKLELACDPVALPGGEGCKNDFTLVERIHSLVERHGLCRHSFILAIGGGALLDLAGYAAATAHRGIRLIRMPTTTLAMNDAGVGVKNGINAFGRKNFTGTFAPPFAVINDFAFLDTLSRRDLRAGIAEAVKVALVRDRSFFDYLHAARLELAALNPGVMEQMIVRCARLHLEHIRGGGDPFESGSSRPLDFGHWAAHKLEELTAGELRHGEAVAVGIALDSLYSCQLGLMGQVELRRIFATLEEIGFALYHPALSVVDVESALREFREHLGGELNIPLLKGIGERIDHGMIDVALYRRCIAHLASRRRPGSASRSVEPEGERESVGTSTGFPAAQYTR